MALSSLDDKSHQPAEEDLTRVLGSSRAHWDKIKAMVAAEYPPMVEEWAFSGEKYGWSVRLKQKKRTIIYLIPGDGRFLCGFVLGERAVAAARESSLRADVLEAIEEAPKYAEGRGLRLVVRSPRDVAPIQQLVRIKMAH